MKFLLTSGGIRNNSLKQALLALAGKQSEDLAIAYIPTAANVEPRDKSWVIDRCTEFKNIAKRLFDIVDISAVPRDIWLSRLQAVDVIVFGGGNTYHLIYQVRKSGLEAELPKLLENRVYVGISAGSAITAKDISFSQSRRLYSDEIGEITDTRALGFVDFRIFPHLNSPKFPYMCDEKLREIAKMVPETIYALDDESAIQVVDGETSIISEGEWRQYN